jgi:hypothetical protein
MASRFVSQRDLLALLSMPDGPEVWKVRLLIGIRNFQRTRAVFVPKAGQVQEEHLTDFLSFIKS